MKSILLLSLLFLFSCSKKNDIDIKEIEKVAMESARKMLPEEALGTIRHLKEAGLLELETKGLPYYLYFSDKDGRYFIYGDLSLMGESEPINLSAELRTKNNSVVVDEILSLPDSDFLAIFKAKKDTGKTIYVFVDMFCGYCEKLHKDIKTINDMGINVKYLALPVLRQDSLTALISVYCASDRAAAFNGVITTKTYKEASCSNPTEKHISYSKQLVVRGTPYIIFSNGKINPGYLPPNEIAKMFE